MSVTLHTPETIYSARHLPSWLLLASAAGAVNGFAFLTCQQFVTHVTGTATRIGLEWQHLAVLGEYAVVLLCFVAGAAASVLALQARAVRGEQPQWAAPLVAVAVILAGAGLAGHLGAFGQIGEAAAGDPPPFIMLSLLAFAMGLQNATVGTTTGLAVRTTHLTGPATDVGVHLGSAWFIGGEEARLAFQGAVLRGGKMVAFVVGAGLSVPLTAMAGYLALLVPAAFVLVATALSFVPGWGPVDETTYGELEGVTNGTAKGEERGHGGMPTQAGVETARRPL